MHSWHPVIGEFHSEVRLPSLAPWIINFMFWWIVHTQTLWVPLAPASTHSLGLKDAINIEKPILVSGNTSLNFWKISFRLQSTKYFCLETRRPSSLNRHTVLLPRHQSTYVLAFVKHLEVTLSTISCGKGLDFGSGVDSIPFSWTSAFAFLAMKSKSAKLLGHFTGKRTTLKPSPSHMDPYTIFHIYSPCQITLNCCIFVYPKLFGL